MYVYVYIYMYMVYTHIYPPHTSFTTKHPPVQKKSSSSSLVPGPLVAAEMQLDNAQQDFWSTGA